MAKKSFTKTSEEKAAEITFKGVVFAAVLGFLGVVITARLNYSGGTPPSIVTVPSQTSVPITNPTIIQQLFEVSSTESWQQASIIEVGDMVTITYKSGQWTNNKENITNSPYVDSVGYDPSLRGKFEEIVQGANLAALIGRIGVDYSFTVGNEKAFQSSESGNLELQMNDEGLANNDGSILVEIVIRR